jgi:hypothetical protein
VQDRAPASAEAAAGPLAQPAPDFAVEPVALPLGHGDVAGEGVEQADVLVGGVLNFPAEAADRDIGEQAGRFYLGPLVGQFAGLGEMRARGQALVDLVVDALDLLEEPVTPGRERMCRRPEGKMAALAQQFPGLAVANGRVDPVPGGGGIDQVKAGLRRLPALEGLVHDRHLREPGEVTPCLGCQIGADLKAGDLEPALRERNGRLTGRAANLQQPVTGPQPRQPH